MNSNNIYQIHKQTLLDNLTHIKNKVGNKKVCAMVKANAYGLGVPYIIPMLKGKVDFYGVSCVGEAKEVKKIDQDTPILIVGKTSQKELLWCSEHQVRVTVSNLEEYQECIKSGLPLVLHIKINTGMNRYGIKSVKTLRTMLDSKTENIVIEGIMTHFATKEKDQEFIKEQYMTFQCFVALMPKDCIAHCASSYVTMHHPEYLMDMVRVGYSLYNGKKQTISIYSKIIDIQEIEKGDTVGYDRTFRSKESCRIGVIPIGYADGFDRRLSNRFEVWVKNQYVPVVGNICMDVFFVKIDDTIKVGDKVEILGTKMTYEKYAKCLRTSAYDCMLKFRYRRMKVMKI